MVTKKWSIAFAEQGPCLHARRLMVPPGLWEESALPSLHVLCTDRRCRRMSHSLSLLSNLLRSHEFNYIFCPVFLFIPYTEEFSPSLFPMVVIS